MVSKEVIIVKLLIDLITLINLKKYPGTNDKK